MERSVCFKIEGEWLTDWFRNLYYSNGDSLEECTQKLNDSLCLGELGDSEKIKLATAIIFGEKKFVGVNALDLVDDFDFDVYNYTKFPKPMFEMYDNGVRGVLTREGIFVECEYQGHYATINKIGTKKAKESVSFWKGLAGNGVSKDKYKIPLTKNQKDWYVKNKKYLCSQQVKDFELILENEVLFS